MLLGYRRDITEVGFERTGHGAWVDWDALTARPLSSTESRWPASPELLRRNRARRRRAVHLAAAVVDAVTAVTGKARRASNARPNDLAAHGSDRDAHTTAAGGDTEFVAPDVGVVIHPT